MALVKRFKDMKISREINKFSHLNCCFLSPSLKKSNCEREGCFMILYRMKMGRVLVL